MKEKTKKKKDGWFFTRSVLNEINELTDGLGKRKQEENQTSTSKNRVHGDEEIHNDARSIDQNLENKDTLGQFPSVEKENAQSLKKTKLSSKEVDRKANNGNTIGEIQSTHSPTEKQKQTGGSQEIHELQKENRRLKDAHFELEQANHELLNSQASFSTVTNRLMKQKERALADCEHLRTENQRLIDQNLALSDQIQTIKKEAEVSATNQQVKVQVKYQETLELANQRLEKIQQLEHERFLLKERFDNLQKNYEDFSNEVTKFKQYYEEKEQFENRPISLEKKPTQQVENCLEHRSSQASINEKN